MLDWVREHVEWVLGTLGGAALGAVAWCIKFVHKVGRLGDRLADLEQKHAEDVKPLRERFVKLEATVTAMKDDIAEGREAHRELVEEVRKDREEAKKERRDINKLLRAIYQEVRAPRIQGGK